MKNNIIIIILFLCSCSLVSNSVYQSTTLEDYYQDGENLRILITRKFKEYDSPMPWSLYRWSHNVEARTLRVEYFYFEGEVKQVLAKDAVLSFYKIGEHKTADEGVYLSILNDRELLTSSDFLSCSDYSGDCFTKDLTENEIKFLFDDIPRSISYQSEKYYFSRLIFNNSIKVFKEGEHFSRKSVEIPFQLIEESDNTFSLRVYELTR